MKKWQSILLYLGVAYIVLLLGPIAGFDLPKIIGEIASNPEVFIQQLLVGLVNGAVIAIIALGYTMVYGIIELINFAHGDLYMLGAFASLTVFGAFGLQDWRTFRYCYTGDISRFNCMFGVLCGTEYCCRKVRLSAFAKCSAFGCFNFGNWSFFYFPKYGAVLGRIESFYSGDGF
jgi:Branched-chain amino acid ABC-type transport system, permease components